MSVSTSDFLTVQSPSVNSTASDIAVETKVYADSRLTRFSQDGDKTKTDETSEQTVSFSEQLSKIQQTGNQTISTPGNKLPLSNPIIDSLSPENPIHKTSGETLLTDSNHSPDLDGLELLDLIKTDSGRISAIEDSPLPVSDSRLVSSASRLSLDSDGKLPAVTNPLATIDRMYNTGPFGQSMISYSDNITTLPIEEIHKNPDLTLPVKIEGKQTAAQLPALEQAPASLISTNGVTRITNIEDFGAPRQTTEPSNHRSNTDLILDKPNAYSNLKSSITSNFSVASEGNEPSLDGFKFSNTKEPIVTNSTLADKLEPKAKFVAQEIKGPVNNIAHNIGNGKIANPLSSVLISNQDSGQPAPVHNINNQSVSSLNTAVQTLPNLHTDQNNSSILQQGLSLRQDFSPNLANRIQWIYQQALASAEILMDPPELGPLSVKLHANRGETNILFQVSNPQTKDMIEENLSKLKELLEQQGIQLGDTQVEHKETNRETKDGLGRSDSLASDEIENPQDSGSLVHSVGLLDTYA